MIRAIIFDLDDTLYDEMQFVTGGFQAVARFMSLHYAVDEESFFHLLFTTYGKYGRGKIFDRALQEIGLYKKSLVQRLVQEYRYHEPKLSLYADARMALMQLKNCYKIGLITDGNQRVQRNKIKALHLNGFFKVAITTTSYGLKNQKPATLPYTVALRKLAIRPTETVYVGDNPHKDFIGAKKLGLKTIRLLRGTYQDIKLDSTYEAELKINNFSQLMELDFSLP